MSGANRIKKHAEWDREEYFRPLRFFGTEFHQREPLANSLVAPGTVALTGNQILHEIVFDALSPLNVSGPSVSDALALGIIPSNALSSVGSTWTIPIQNIDAVDHTITFPAGWTVTPNPLVIPANSYGLYTFNVTALTPVQTIQLIHTDTNSPPGAIPPTGVTSWNGRTGDVFPDFFDYSASMVSNNSLIPGVSVRDALDNISNQFANLNTDQVFNNSLVTGITTSDALNALLTQISNHNLGSTNASLRGLPAPAVIAAGAWTVVAGLPTFSVHNSIYAAPPNGFTQSGNGIADDLPTGGGFTNDHRLSLSARITTSTVLVPGVDVVGVRIVGTGATPVVSETKHEVSGIAPETFSTAGDVHGSVGGNIYFIEVFSLATALTLTDAGLFVDFVSFYP